MYIHIVYAQNEKYNVRMRLHTHTHTHKIFV